ncbi:MAG: hypothetical protein ACKN9U_16640, partial [Pirellulaceae bacterium]
VQKQWPADADKSPSGPLGVACDGSDGGLKITWHVGGDSRWFSPPSKLLHVACGCLPYPIRGGSITIFPIGNGRPEGVLRGWFGGILVPVSVGRRLDGWGESFWAGVSEGRVQV